MGLKHVLRPYRRALGYIALRFSFVLVRIVPLNFLKVISEIISQLGYLLAGRHKKTAYNNLELAFSNSLSKADKKKIVIDSFRYMAQDALELVYCAEHAEQINRLIDIEGKDNLERAFSKNYGVIGITAHFGNFPLMQFRLAKEGYQINSIMRHMRDVKTDRLVLKKRDLIGVKTIYSEPRISCVSESLKSLKNNELLFILLDQNFGTGGVFVNFFGRKAATATGPVILAQRSKAAIVPMFFIHGKTGIHKIIIEKEFELENISDKEQNIVVNTQRITDIIESYIRRYPAEWSWIHKRWKTQPKEQ